MAAVAFQCDEQHDGEVPVAGVVVSVLWVGCLAVSLLGGFLPYARPVAPSRTEPPLQAEMLEVQLTRDALAAPATAVLPAAAMQPPTLAQMAVPERPALTAVAEAQAVAFALPVEGPTQMVEPARASFAAAAPVERAVQPAVPVVRTLTYGRGEGVQPAPEYPLRARREGQEGVVGVRFSVGENGRVLAAETSAPCAWSLLNDAAVRVVRDRWRFAPGTIRHYDVTIRFQLTK
jgi:TonB family protein